jgi:PD-(D/E)XK nuclease superfamily
MPKLELESHKEEGKIVIRPSSIDSFTNCAYQWYNVFILDKKTIPNARAAMGTAIHKAAEVLWTDAIKTKKKDANTNMLVQAALEEYKELDKGGLQYDEDENLNTAQLEIAAGTGAFIEDIVPFVDIPTAVEKRYTIKIDHPLVSSISGTVDYIKEDGEGIIADVKTSKRKPVNSNYTTQQSTYRLLAEAGGINVTENRIQAVVLTKSPYGTVEKIDTNVKQAKYLINNLLDTIELYNAQTVDPKTLFRGNPKYYLCSNKYCSLYSTCPFVNGDL